MDKKTTPLCAFTPCSREVEIKQAGLCRGHYQQQWNGKQLKPIRPRTRPMDISGTTGRVCTACDTYKPWSDYYVRNNGVPRAECKRCVIDKASASQARRQAQRAGR